MGSISNQAFKSSIFSYLGVLIGFVTIGFLLPRLFSTGEVGVIRLILNYSEIAARIAALGSGTLILRYFKLFKNPNNKNNGFLTYMILINIIGFILFFVGFQVVDDYLIDHNQSRSPLFAEYFKWILPITLSVLIFHLMDTYATALKLSAVGIFFREFIQRILILFLLVGTGIFILPFSTIIGLYMLIIISTPLLLIVYLLHNNHLGLGINLNFLNKKLLSEMGSVASFALFTGIGGTAVVFIDNIMINELMGENQTGIYSTLFFYTALILIPTKSISKIASSYVADAFVSNNKNEIKSIYYKSCLNQFIPGLLIFIFIWTNSDFIFYILPSEYQNGKYILLILGIGNLFNAATGVNTQIIAFSPFHKYNTIFIIGLLIITIVSNIVFIPIYGITGAAIATAISLFTFNLAKFLLILLKYGLQPFDKKYLILISITLPILYLGSLIVIDNIFLQSTLRTILVFLLFVIPTYSLNISPDLNAFIINLVKKYVPFSF